MRVGDLGATWSILGLGAADSYGKRECQCGGVSDTLGQWRR